MLSALEQTWGDGPLDIEIGCGVGMHPLQYAMRNPKRRIIAIEKSPVRFAKFHRRIQNHPRLSNLLAVHADARRWIPGHVGRSTVDRYIFMYPNPRPKNSYRRQRWYASNFMKEVISTLRPGGEIRICTNIKSYAMDAGKTLIEEWGFEGLSIQVVNRRQQPTFRVRTHFEKKYFARDEDLFELAAHRK